MLLTIIVFAIIIILLVMVHEFGHFIAAKLTGVKVEEFAFGFPPRLLGWKKGETLYAINLIPLGGYNKLYGEEEQVKKAGSFLDKPVWNRILIVVAGAFMNFVLAIILMTIGFSMGMTPLVSDPAKLPGEKTAQVMVEYVQPGSVAEKAGITTGTILNGFSSGSDLQNFTRSHAGQSISLRTEKNGQQSQLNLTLSTDQNAPLGVGIVALTRVKENVFQALWTSVKEIGLVIAAIFVFLWDIIKALITSGHAGPAAEGVVGPVGLFNFTSAALKIGWIYVLQLVALLSINLGLINLLPFPALDGGKVLFLSLEGVFRRKIVRQEVENIIHMIGFALLILLIIGITYRDIINLH